MLHLRDVISVRSGYMNKQYGTGMDNGLLFEGAALQKALWDHECY